MSEVFKIAGIGEVLFDILPEGKKLGGAPVNFTFHAKQLGLNVFPVCSVGRDSYGFEIIDRLKESGLSTDYIQQNEYPTGTARVSIDTFGVPNFTLNQNVAWDHIELTDNLIELAGNVDAVCFGTLAQRSSRSCSTIHEFLQNTSNNCLKIFDINLRQNYYSSEIIDKSLYLANILKLNDLELDILREIFNLPESIENAISVLQARYDLDYIALTRGADGALLKSRKEICDCPGLKTEVIDTIGAGDSYTAVLAFGVLHKLPLEQINRLANSVAAYVCSQFGASPVLPDSLIFEFANI